ncbi:MAG: hypothetical protein AAGK00_04025 [Pseudomonadota bacterium]
MRPDFRTQLGQMLPEQMAYPYFAEREAPWLLCHRLGAEQRLSKLRQGPLAPLLNRPGAREIAAACGDGWVSPGRLLPLADPLHAFGREHELMTDRPAELAFDMAAGAAWQTFTVSFTEWAGQRGSDWRWKQVSRPGGNLVLQLNLPDAYRARFDRLFSADERRWIEYYGHPVRRDATITLAWARLDLEAFGGDVLIEEVQTDWLRALKELRRALLRGLGVRKSETRRAFMDETEAMYGRSWARALMLAVLAFAVRELGARRIWMHQPEMGAKLKNIKGLHPPRSLYTDLPRRFGFQATDHAPAFLYKSRSQVMARMRRTGRPLFWVLDLNDRVQG